MTRAPWHDDGQAHIRPCGDCRRPMESVAYRWVSPEGLEVLFPAIRCESCAAFWAVGARRRGAA